MIATLFRVKPLGANLNGVDESGGNDTRSCGFIGKREFGLSIQ